MVFEKLDRYVHNGISLNAKTIIICDKTADFIQVERDKIIREKL